MFDPNLQDAYEDDLRTIQYNKAIEALIPLVKEERAVFDGFLRDEYPDLYEKLSEEDIGGLQSTLNRIKRTDPMTDKWLEYVEDEARRRVEG